jgi:hypothetical protein
MPRPGFLLPCLWLTLPRLGIPLLCLWCEHEFGMGGIHNGRGAASSRQASGPAETTAKTSKKGVRNTFKRVYKRLKSSFKPKDDKNNKQR